MSHEEAMLDYISTGILALDDGLQVVDINSAGESLLQTSAGQCVNRHASKLVLSVREWLEPLEQVLASKAPQSCRGVRLVLQTGQDLHCDLLITPVLQPGSAYSLIVEVLAIDRLMRISREEGLVHTHETTRAILRGLAHEIKNPLGGVRGAAQLLARELPDESLAEYTHIIIREADRLRDLVDRMLGPTRQLAPEVRNIHEVLEHVRNLISAEAQNKNRFVRDYDPSLPDFAYDKPQIIQCVLNIVRNAMQASEDSTITLRTRPQRQFTVGNQRHRLMCRVDIHDDGPGIPEAIRHAVFAPMVTGRAEGTGLGLSIAQSIVTRHQGVLACESEPGDTTFTFYLPMELEHATAN